MMRALSPVHNQMRTICLSPHLDNSMEMCASVANNNTYLFTKGNKWAINAKYYRNFVTSLYNSVMPTQKTVCENQCTVDFNYSVILNQLIPCIGETVEEADTAPLFKIEYLNKLYMSRLEQVGVVLESTQPECMLTHFLTAAQ